MANWFDFPVTQGFNPPVEYGTDFGTPFHTPITDILAGVVQRVNCAVGYRCEVDVAAQLNGRPVTETWLHIDQPAVTVGQQLSPGDLIGLSGGQLSGGLNPDSPNVSTGPHVEFDIFQGGPFQNPINPVSIARGGPSGVNIPNPFYNLGNAIGQGIASGNLPSLPDPAAAVAGAIAGIPTTIGHGLAGALTAVTHDAATFAQRQLVALAVAAVVLLVLFR